MNQTGLGLVGARAQVPARAMAALARLRDAQAVAVAAMARLLSNHGSEWIESMLAGRLSFGEFCALEGADVDVFVREVRARNRTLFAALRPEGEDGGERGREVRVDVEEVEGWRERVEGLNWVLKARR
jgi:hypothetical protein